MRLKMEIEANNRVMADLQSKIRDLQEFISTLEKKKADLEKALRKDFNQKDRFISQFDLFIDSWHKV